MKKLYIFLVIALLPFKVNSQIINIPDANFKSKLLLASPINTIASNASNVYIKIDANNNNEIEVSEALQVAGLNIANSSISNLTGIASFTNLHSLDCQYNQLATLNLSGLNSLVNLICSDNQISTLNLNGLNVLTYLNCADNQIQSLDLTSLNNLIVLNCGANLLTALNFNGLNSLVNLTCAYNQITSLDLTNLNLTELQCHYNALTTLDVSNMSNLIILFCGNNQLSSLNVSGLPNLLEFDAGTNLLTTINLTALPNLEDINLDLNLLTSIDLSSLPNVTNIDLVQNHLTEILCKNGHNENLYFISNPDLYHICSDDSQITSLQNQAASYGYTNCTVDSACLLLNEDFNVDNSFSVSPNPANQVLNLNAKADIEVKSIHIYNLLGQMVIAILNAQSIATLDVSGLKIGTYFIKADTNKGTSNTKFIKN